MLTCFISELDLDKAAVNVTAAWSFLKDFPINTIAAATDIPSLMQATLSCLRHMHRIKHSGYDVTRAAKLVDGLGATMHTRLVAILKEKDITRCSIEDFRGIKHDCDDLFRTWDTEVTFARVALNDQAKRKHLKKLNFKVNFEHTFLEQRLISLEAFREQHQLILSILCDILPDQDDIIVTNLQESYKLFCRSHMDVLDASTAEGQGTFTKALGMYEHRLERTDDAIIVVMEEQLKAAASTDETFRLFSVFNPLFFRTSIRNAVNSFRVTLVKSE